MDFVIKHGIGVFFHQGHGFGSSLLRRQLLLAFNWKLSLGFFKDFFFDNDGSSAGGIFGYLGSNLVLSFFTFGG